MKLYRIQDQIIIEHQQKLYKTHQQDWDALVNQQDLHAYLLALIKEQTSFEQASWLSTQRIQAPIVSQEIWAAGVTYLRSKVARMEESKVSGGADFYAKVYDAERPELFFKSTAQRCSGPGEPVFIRSDSHWNVPEPELTLFANCEGKIVGYTIGNDMSSRDIEGENPLYLPQAKCYERAAAIGPCLWIPEAPIDPDTRIHMEIHRKDETVFSGEISINQMKRKHDELIGYLFRAMRFSQGVYLMTGTCLVPPNEFTLQEADLVIMQIDGIGRLENTVEKLN
jgi:2-dehydro-3-deoxy-D-arabinonate dehydratase